LGNKMILFFKRKFRVVFLVSGRGSNLEAVINNIKNKKLKNVKIVLVISDNPEAKALEIAKKNKIRAIYLYPGEYKTKLCGEAEDNYIKTIKKVKPDLIVLAGFMRVVKEKFIKSFQNKIINIHPSLLPKYPGLNTHKRVLEAREKETGCTVHFVNEIVDGGKRIIQAKVKVYPDDTEEKLSKRVLEKEHIILSKAIELIAQKKVVYENWNDNPIIIED